MLYICEFLAIVFLICFVVGAFPSILKFGLGILIIIGIIGLIF